MKRTISLLALLLISICSYSQDKRPDLTYRILEVSYVSVNVADYITTIHGLNKGAREANPIASKMNPYAMAGLKLASTTSVIILGRVAYKHNPKAAKATMIAMNIISGAVIANNISVVIKIGK